MERSRQNEDDQTRDHDRPVLSKLQASQRLINTSSEFNPFYFFIRDLRDTGRAHAGLIEEDPSEVIFVWEYFILHWQKRTAGIDEIDTRQFICETDLLSS